MGQIISPTPIGYNAVALSWLVGRAITDVVFHNPVPWVFSFGAREHLGVECLWRIVRDGRVVLTSLDHGHQFGLPAPVDAVAFAREALVGRPVTRVHLREKTADLRFDFSDALCLEVLATSSGYDSWRLRAPDGREYFADSGGRICVWMKND